MTPIIRSTSLGLMPRARPPPPPGLATSAGAQTRLKFVLNWKYQGPQGIFFLADDRGYFKSEGIDLTIDQGSGSSAPIAQVASGTYDIGFGESTPSSSSPAGSPRMHRSQST